jgi:hypothetical protein
MSASTFSVEHASIDTWRTEKDARMPQRTSVLLRYPSLTTTVPKEFVHRASVAEVMLTDWARTDDTHFTVSSQWPRGHSFFTAVEGCYDPLMAAETIRQTGLLLAHTEFAVPLDHRFLVSDLWFEVDPLHLRVGGTPASHELEITCRDIKRRRSGLSGLTFDSVFYQDGQAVATGGGTLSCVSPEVYRRLRPMTGWSGFRCEVPLTAPTAPQSVGRMSPTDVVLSPTQEPDRWRLRLDTRHPVLFDHPVDHVPGMVLMEAARQATIARLGRTCLPVRMDCEFKRYTELDTPCMIEARKVPSTHGPQRETVLVTAHQDDAVVFWCSVEVSS